MKNKGTDSPASWEEELWESQPLMERSKIKQDTYLNCFCPHCGVELNDGDKAVFEIVNNEGQIGTSKVSPYLNVLDRESSFHVEDDEELADIRCPHCHVSIIEPGILCKEDGCKLMGFHVSVSNSIKLKLIVCIRRSCRWYTMSEEDNERLILRNSHEW